MVDGQVQNEFDVSFMAKSNQLFKVLHLAKLRVDGVIVDCIVFVIGV